MRNENDIELMASRRETAIRATQDHAALLHTRLDRAIKEFGNGNSFDIAPEIQEVMDEISSLKSVQLTGALA